MVLRPLSVNKASWPGYSFHNQVKLVKHGSDYFTLLQELIENARHFIHLQVYIFDDDVTGNRVADALMAAANRGVSVWIVLDGFASSAHRLIEKMRAAGIYIRLFNPVWGSRHFYFGRRLHHKLVVVDGMHAMIGSRNIADRYNDLPGQPAWFDTALYVHGQASKQLSLICCRYLHKKERAKAITLSDSVIDETFLFLETDHCAVKISSNDWVTKKEQVTRTYEQIIREAKKELYIVCSYFLPGKTIRNLLAAAAKRGVIIKIVLAGKSDVKTSKLAEKYLYRWMKQHHIHIYEYQPTVLHAKYAIADGTMMTLGSYNINSVSKYACIELNLDIKDAEVASKAAHITQRLIERDCIRITAQKITAPYHPVYWIQAAAFFIVKALIGLSTFYFRQKE